MNWFGSWHYRLHDLDFFPERNSVPILPTKEEVAVLIDAITHWVDIMSQLSSWGYDCPNRCNIFKKDKK